MYAYLISSVQNYVYKNFRKIIYFVKKGTITHIPLYLLMFLHSSSIL
jgi:hypothetical protein